MESPVQHAVKRSEYVLVVDDDPEMLLIMRWALEDEGFMVETARDGREALHRAGDRKPALLVLDVPLPGVDSEELAAGLRSLHGEFPILVVTEMGEAAESAGRIGALDCLSKPFDLPEFIASVRRGVARAGERMRA